MRRNVVAIDRRAWVNSLNEYSYLHSVKYTLQMKKVVLISVLVVVLAAIGWWFTRPASPSGKSSITHNGLEVSVSYSRPYKKGRVIFDDASTGALQPYGQYWRLGANAATEVTFNRDVKFAGELVKAGTYRMYAVPGAQLWQVTLNSALGQSGSELPDKNLDVLNIGVQPRESDTELEQLTIEFAPGGAGVIMEIKWDYVIVAVEIS